MKTRKEQVKATIGKLKMKVSQGVVEMVIARYLESVFDALADGYSVNLYRIGRLEVIVKPAGQFYSGLCKRYMHSNPRIRIRFIPARGLNEILDKKMNEGQFHGRLDKSGNLKKEKKGRKKGSRKKGSAR